MTSMFTLAPADHSTIPMELETSYKCWSTYKRDGDVIYVRSNNTDRAGGQVWTVIAKRMLGVWRVDKGRGFFTQGGMLLARHLMQRGERMRCLRAYPDKVRRYKATPKAYSLPTILNRGISIVSRDRLADERSAARKVDIGAAMAARKKV